jgi:hypothetical protein
VVLLLLVLDANLKCAIAGQNVVIPLGVWARFNLIFDALFGRLDWQWRRRGLAREAGPLALR